MREFFAESGLVEFAQGHASAFGISIFDKDIQPLIKYIDVALKDLDFTNCYRVDFIWAANEAE
jgi:single-stranded DNA-specific DHH superfamily exonuclease